MFGNSGIKEIVEIIRYITKSNDYYRRIRAGDSRIWDCEHIYKELLQELFRKNTKQSVSNQVIPTHNYRVVGPSN